MNTQQDDPGGELFTVVATETTVVSETIQAGEFFGGAQLVTDTAKRFATAHLVLEDLRFARQCFGEALSAGVPDNSLLKSKAFVFAGVVAYARCFGTGVRGDYLLDLDHLTAAHIGFDRKLHEYFIALRNKHVAHPVNDMEVSRPYARVIRAQDGTLRDGGAVGVVMRQLIGVSAQQLQAVTLLIDQLTSYVALDIESQRVKVHTEFREAGIAVSGKFSWVGVPVAINRDAVGQRRR